MVSRQTASKYLDIITQTGLLKKIKMGKENYYINTKLVDLFINQSGDHRSNNKRVKLNAIPLTCCMQHVKRIGVLLT